MSTFNANNPSIYSWFDLVSNFRNNCGGESKSLNIPGLHFYVLIRYFRRDNLGDVLIFGNVTALLQKWTQLSTHTTNFLLLSYF